MSGSAAPPSPDAGPGDSRQAARARRLGGALSLVIPLCFGVIGLGLGKDAGWDLLNYHWYNPHALLQGRLGFDLAVAHHATYYNPAPDLPFFTLARAASAWVAGFAVAAVQGLNFTLLYWLAHAVLRPPNPWTRVALAAGTALAGVVGGGALALLGSTSNDTVVSLGVFASLLVLVRQGLHGPLRRAGPGVALAGACAGAAAGLKLTAAIYPAGLCLAFLCLPARPARRLALGLVFGLGGLAGFAAAAGPWMLEVWRHTGNPHIPYFNGLLHTPRVV
ncbi:MAG: hypothetical protein ACYDA8_18385, partial [Deferrisomatales bacterium]